MSDSSRCTVCGASRIPLNREGTKFGVCTLIGCPDPMHDLEAEASPEPQPEGTPYCPRCKTFFDVATDGQAEVVRYHKCGAIARLKEKPCGSAQTADIATKEDSTAKVVEGSEGLLSCPQRIVTVRSVAELEKILNEPEPNVNVLADGSCEPPVPPAGARDAEQIAIGNQIMLRLISEVAWMNKKGAIDFREYLDKQLALLAAQERERADKAERRLATFEDEHKRSLILLQTAVDLQRELGEMQDALTKLVDKLKVVHDSDEYRGVFGLAVIHGCSYTGPTYEAEMKTAEALLSRKEKKV